MENLQLDWTLFGICLALSLGWLLILEWAYKKDTQRAVRHQVAQIMANKRPEVPYHPRQAEYPNRHTRRTLKMDNDARKMLMEAMSDG